MSAPATDIPSAEALVITGIGMATPLGFGATEVFDRFQAGHTAIAPPRHFDPRIRS